MVIILPTLAPVLGLHPGLIVWPIFAYFQKNGACLLLVGFIADVVGNKSVNLTCSFFVAIFVLASALARSDLQLIMFRAMAGVAGALALPTSMAIVSKSVESGRRRNLGFATLGLAQPLGYSLGLVLGGLMAISVGWRCGFYIGGALSFLLSVIGIWVLPAGYEACAGA